jgi:ABC-type spermidine/putrescine transport system permease subunit I
MVTLGGEVYNNVTLYLNWPQAAAISIVLAALTIALHLALGRALRSHHLEQDRAQR